MTEEKLKSIQVEVSAGVHVQMYFREGDKDRWSCNASDWFQDPLTAFEHAVKHGYAVEGKEATPGQQDLHAWVILLMTEMSNLKPGEALEITRGQNHYLVTKEAQVIPALNVSMVSDLEFRIEEANEDTQS